MGLGKALTQNAWCVIIVGLCWWFGLHGPLYG